jgi:hypothetical protein
VEKKGEESSTKIAIQNTNLNFCLTKNRNKGMHESVKWNFERDFE